MKKKKNRKKRRRIKHKKLYKNYAHNSLMQEFQLLLLNWRKRGRIIH